MLKFVGGSDKFYPGIPPQDLSEEEAKQYGGEKFLLSTGLWKKVAGKQEKEPKEE